MLHLLIEIETIRKKEKRTRDREKMGETTAAATATATTEIKAMLRSDSVAWPFGTAETICINPH